MNVNPKSIVVSYNQQAEAFHRETLREHVQGNALRMLLGHGVAYHAIAIVDTPEEADKAIEVFTHMRQIAEGAAEPALRAS